MGQGLKESKGMITCELQAMIHSGKPTIFYTSFLLQYKHLQEKVRRGKRQDYLFFNKF